MLTAVLAVSCGRQNGAVSAVPQSTQRRSKLDSGGGRVSSYVTDRVGWLEENRALAEAGLSYFFDKTGVQPHIYLRQTQNREAGSGQAEWDSYAEALYGSLFSDERHLLVLVEEQETAGDSQGLRYGLAWGKQAAAVMDQEAREILDAYWAVFLADSGELADGQKASALAEVFQRTADNIMMVKKTGGWIWALGILVGGILLLAAWEFQKNWKKLKIEEPHSPGV